MDAFRLLVTVLVMVGVVVAILMFERRRAEASTLAMRARRGITTPLGLPVDPEVSISRGSGLSASSHRDSCLIATEGSSEGRRRLTGRTLAPRPGPAL